MTYKTLSTQLANDGGCGVEIAPVADKADTYIVNNFYDKGLSIEMVVDAAAGTFTIANQQLTTIDGAGRVDIAFCTSDGTPDYSRELTGVINADGSLLINSWWGIYVREGEYADRSLGWFHTTELKAANATMTAIPADGSANEKYGVVLSQQGNVITVSNFANHGHPVEIVVNDDHTGQIDQQVVYVHVEQGNVYVSGYTAKDATTINLVRPIELNKSDDVRTISWNNWTIYSANGYFNLWSGGVIETDFDIDYPQIVTSLDGDGTEASPYLIRTIADLSFLSRQCAADATAGKYYAIDNDIDMSGYRFVPVGTADHPFEGVLDGRGHTLGNLAVEGTTAGYAALIGSAGRSSVLRGIKLSKPKVSGKGRYTAALVAYSDGSIIDCHVDQGTIGSDYSTVAGMAGHACTVDNCSVTLTQVVGLNGYVSGLVSILSGNMTSSSATDVIVYAGSSSNGRTPSGGLAASASEGCSIHDCRFSGLLSGRPTYNVGQCIGGIVGEGYRADIQRCFVVAEIQGYTSDAITGGISGHFAGNISDCFSAGRVGASASEKTGGLVGYLDPIESSTVANCYISASVLALTYPYDTATGCRELIGNYAEANASYDNVWFDASMTPGIGSQLNALNTAKMTSASGIQGLDSDKWTFSAGTYPRLKGQADTNAAALAATAVDFQSNDNITMISGNTVIHTVGETMPLFVVDGNYTATGRGATITRTDASTYNLRLNGKFATDTLVYVNGNVQYIMHVVKFSPKVFDGDGTAESPYLIRNKEDLCKLADITTNQQQPFNGIYFRMTDDIDMSGVEDFIGIACVPYSRTVTFGGIFDGDGHAIHNLVMDGIVWTKAPANPDVSWADGTYATTGQPAFRALFGYLNGLGKILNLTLAADCSIAGGSYVGGFVINNSGTIRNCRNYARIRSLQGYGAGIAVNNGGSIYDCLNAGEVSVNSSYAAGIACYNYGTIGRVMNTGDISAKTLARTADDKLLKYSGGIVAYANGFSVRDAVNAGTVYSEKGECGGIVAYNPAYGSGSTYNTLLRVINYGMVSGGTVAYTGSIVGAGSTKGTVDKVYWDNQILTVMPEGNASHTGMVAMTTAQLTSGTPLEGFDTEVWAFEQGTYPCLKSLADAAPVKSAIHTVVTMPDEQTAKNLLADATLSAAEGLQWSLTGSDKFAIDGTTLKVEAEVVKYETATLTATWDNYVKVIDIAHSPAIKLAGEGTNDDPYRLASVDDWNILADYVWLTKSDMDGQYVKVMNDIDFKDQTFKPVAIGGDTWSGHLMGDGNTLANINYVFTEALDANGTAIRNSAGKQGVIGKLGPNGSISDLTVTGYFEQTKATYSGVFVGECYGAMTNCVNKATITGNKAYRAGFAALAYEGARFTDCINRGTVTGTGTAGNGAGIIAEVKGPVTLIRCGNEGTVEGGGTYYGCLVSKCLPSTFIECYNSADQNNAISFYGGLIGDSNGSSSYPNFRYTLDRCYNTGNLATKGNAGGLISSCGSSNCAVDANECYNTGNISTTGTVGTAAGLFVSLAKSSHVTNCWNSGDIITTQSKSYAAGIAKETKASPQTEPCLIENCYNTGTITSDGSLAAGLVAQPGNYMVMDHCYNTGDVSAKTYSVGGLAANSFSTFSILNSWNSGNVTAGSCRAGGIVGTSQTAAITVSDCVNFGDVSSLSANKGVSDSGDAACGFGIGGLAGVSGGTFIRCYNVGQVKGAWQVGGLVGQPYAGPNDNQPKLTISDCYNMGDVVADADACGAIVGINAEVNDDNTTAKYWSDAVRIDNVHYLDGACTSSLTGTGTAIDNNSLASLDRGEGWTSADDYSFPELAVHADHPLGHFHAATLVLDANDTYSSVKNPFKVGSPDGVVWTASVDGISVDGNDVIFGDGTWSGPLVMTATLGDHSKQYELMLDAVTSIDDIQADGDVVSLQYFDVKGLPVAGDNVEPGHPYIVITTYTDGTVRAYKVVR